MRGLGLLLGCSLLLQACGGCGSNELLLPSEAGKRQKSLAERILDRALFPDADPGVQQDLSLALGEVVIPAAAPKLRLIVTNGSPILAEGAARALVKIRVLREGDRTATLRECAESETNALVQAECARALNARAQQGTSDTAEISGMVGSEDTERRREGLRRLVALPELSPSYDSRLESALYHLLGDKDLRVQLLSSAVFLRRSLAERPFAIEEESTP